MNEAPVVRSSLPAPLRAPAAWIGIGTLALCGIAGASYLAGRAANRTEPDPAPVAATVHEEAGQREATRTPVHEAVQEAAHDPAPPCAACGVVESVQAAQHKGEGTGIGAVAGGVVGGLVGNQMGAGQGKTAMTVLGAVGGGFAGHEIEKRARSTTVYKVRVRTDDGTVRTFEQPQAPAVGQRVRIEGRKLVPLPAAG